MKVLQCDICKNTHEDNGSAVFLNLYISESNNTQRQNVYTQRAEEDICKECSEKIYQFIKTIKKKTQ